MSDVIPGSTPHEDTELIELAKHRYQQAESYWSAHIDQTHVLERFIAGDQWDDAAPTGKSPVRADGHRGPHRSHRRLLQPQRLLLRSVLR